MKKTKGQNSWALRITVLTFFLSITISVISNIMLENVNLAVAFLVLFVVVAIGIIFDIVGIAVTSALETPFHARASKGIIGSKESIKLIRNADKVSNICNDVVGDTVGIISGGLASAIVALIILEYKTFNALILNLTLSGIVAAATVGGKAAGKGVAINKSDDIVYKVGVLIFYLKKVFTLQFKKIKTKRDK